MLERTRIFFYKDTSRLRMIPLCHIHNLTGCVQAHAPLSLGPHDHANEVCTSSGSQLCIFWRGDTAYLDQC